MAKQRPSLNVQAQPVSTAILPGNLPSAAVELYDEQTVRLALEFSNAFKDLSLTAAQMAGTLKKEANEEELQRGQDLVNSSQKSYKQLVEAGEIKPNENPWMAVGAQTASGTIEGQRARAHFMSLYNRKAEEDPTFLDGPEGFTALASQYTANINSMVGNAPYLSRSFYESFNPFIASMSVAHEENVLKRREQKVTEGVGAATAQALEDLRSADPNVSNNAMAVLQDSVDRFGALGYNQTTINKATTDYLIKQMRDGPSPETAKTLFESLKSGTGSLKDTAYAKALYQQNLGDIQRNLNKLTLEKSVAFKKEVDTLSSLVLAGELTPDQAEEKVQALMTGDKPSIRVDPQEYESKMGFASSEFSKANTQRQRAIEAAKENAIYEFIDMAANGEDPTTSNLVGQDYIDAQKAGLERIMDAVGFDPKTKAEFRTKAQTAFTQGEEAREVKRLNQATNILWEGDGFTQGIKPQLRAALDEFSAKNEAPNWVSIAATLDEFRQEQGVVPGSEKAQNLHRLDYGRIENEVLRPYEQSLAQSPQFGGTLNPLPTDTAEQREAKSEVRARMSFLRMSAGFAFEDDRESQYRLKRLLPALTAVSVETEGNTQELQDTLQSYFMAMDNNIPLDQIIPGASSANGEVIINLLRYAEAKYRAGENISDIARDISQAKALALNLGSKDVDFNNPHRYVQFDTKSGVDAEIYQEGFRSFRESYSLLEPDSVLYTNAVIAEAVQKHLATDRIGNMKGALKDAQAEVLNNHLIVRGSIIPKTKLNPAIDSAFVEAWLDSQGYPAGTTLVVVGRNNDGSAMLAPRLNGRAVANRMIRSTDLNKEKASPNMIKRMNTIRQQKAQDMSARMSEARQEVQASFGLMARPSEK